MDDFKWHRIVVEPFALEGAEVDFGFFRGAVEPMVEGLVELLVEVGGELLDEFIGVALHQKGAGGLGIEAAGLQVEQLQGVQSAGGGAVGALDVVGVNFQFGLVAGAGGIGEQQVVAVHVGVGFLRGLSNIKLTLENGVRAAGEQVAVADVGLVVFTGVRGGEGGVEGLFSRAECEGGVVEVAGFGEGGVEFGAGKVAAGLQGVGVGLGVGLKVQMGAAGEQALRRQRLDGAVGEVGVFCQRDVGGKVVPSIGAAGGDVVFRNSGVGVFGECDVQAVGAVVAAGEVEDVEGLLEALGDGEGVGWGGEGVEGVPFG